MWHMWDINTYKFQWVSQKEREHLEDVSIDGGVILNWILKVSIGWHALYLSGL
jgi:hypothetical protein